MMRNLHEPLSSDPLRLSVSRSVRSSGPVGSFIFLICMLLAALSVNGAQPVLAESYVGRVVGVTDGDTIKVMHNGGAVKIRLAEIDCPEKSQAFGAQAKKFTGDRAFDRDVRIVEVGHDRYGRTVALAFLPNGQCLNEELVSNGYAWCYRKYCKRSEILRLEEQARAEHLGLWSEPGAIEPAQFRKQARATHTQRTHLRHLV